MSQEPWPEAAHRLRSIERHLKEFRDAVPGELGLSLGNMALADNLDWLDCLADALERGTVELRSPPVAVGMEEIARAGNNTPLPSVYQYGLDAMDGFNLGKRMAVEAILALLNPAPTEFAKPTGCDNPVERGRSEGPASATGDSPVGAGPIPSPTEAHRGTELERTGEGN